MKTTTENESKDNEEVVIAQESENQAWYNEKTGQFVQSLLLKDSHKTAKGIQSKKNSINKYIDKTLESICQIPINPNSPPTKETTDFISASVLSKLEMFKQSLIKNNVFVSSMNKKFINATFSLKGQLISMVSKPKSKKEEPKTIEKQGTANKKKATSFSRQIVQNLVNKMRSNNIQLLSLNEAQFFPIQEIQYVDFPAVTQSNFSYEEVYKETEGSEVISPIRLSKDHVKPNSIAIFGTTQNLFFAIGYTDLLIIADASMAIADKLVLEKANSKVRILFVSVYHIFFSHSHYLHIFNYETKQSRSIAFDHQLISICPVLYYLNCLCVLDSFENINLIDYSIPKKLGCFQTKFIKGKSDAIDSVITLNNYLILGGSTIKLFDLKNKKVIPTSQFMKGKADSITTNANAIALLPMASNPIMKMAPIVLNGDKYIDSFVCLTKNGNLELFALDKSNQLRKLSYYTYDGSEPNEYYNLVITRENLVIFSVGFDIKIFNLAIKEEAQFGYMPFISELANIRVNSVINTLFEIKHSLILHGEDVIERFMFFDLDELFLRNKEFDEEQNGLSDNWNEKAIETPK